ncbi:hypothetical protein AAFF_G00091500 [Aldrovandia affinis]|uniref:Adhesion G-protein coupled receptor G2 n=1 Tax=Aldrovandia affinis TaxID=143900 RepID=A0AAD7T2D8_9TELE|nr:hypothetical protein AAFF_G00091500 [Aldrovandia affinis]
MVVLSCNIQEEFKSKRLDSLNGLLRRLYLKRDLDDCGDDGGWRDSANHTSVGCAHTRLLPRRHGTRRMPHGALQITRNRKLLSHFLFALLAVLHQVHPGEGYFLGRWKAVFSRGCFDHWTFVDRQRMPQLIQMTVCVDVRPLHAEGEWTAFTYSSPPAPRYNLALEGDARGLYVWLLGVRHHFPTPLAPLRWHHVCLRHDAYRRTMTLEVDGEAFERTVIARAIAPGGELVLGCRNWNAAPVSLGGAELYLFRVWDDVRDPSACEDGSVVGWDSRDWHIFGTTRVSDDTMQCGLKRARRGAKTYGVGTFPSIGRLFPSLIPATPLATSVPSTISVPLSQTAPGESQQPEPRLVQCSFSEFCAIRIAYYWMFVNVEATGDRKSEAEISTWVSHLFNMSTCVPSNHTSSTTANSSKGNASQSVRNTSSGHWTAKNRVPSGRDQRICSSETEISVSLLQGIEVTCDIKEEIRVTNCTVLLQLSRPTDTCVLRQVLQESSLNTSIHGRVLGDVERVGKGLCQNEDTMPPDGGFVRCTSSTPFSEVCSSEGPVNVTCTYMDTAYVAMEMPPTMSQLCEPMYYVLAVNISSASVSIADLRNVVSQLSSAQLCKNSITMPLCPLFHMMSKLYQGAHLECHGTDSRLHNCMVVLKLSEPMDMCLTSAVLTYLLKDSNDIIFNGLITRAAICGWPSGHAADLLNSRFTWVSVDLHASQICDSHNPVIFTCKEDETLGVLLNESCGSQQPPPSITTPIPVTTPVSPPTPNPTSSYSFSAPFTTAHQSTTSALPMHNNSMPTTPDYTTNASTEATTMDFTTGIQVTVKMVDKETQANQLLDQTRNASTLNSSQVEQLVSGLEDLLSGPNVSLSLGHQLLNVISNLLNASASSLAASSTRIIRVVETLGLKLEVQGETETISSESLGLAVRRVDGANFEETSFSIADPTNLQISVRGHRARRGVGTSALGSITLPTSLIDGLTPQEQVLASRVQFNYYQKSTVFQDRALGRRRLNSGILGSSVANLSISGLKDNVVFTLQNNQPIPGNFVASCVFWDFNQNDGSGGWNSDGCSVQNTTEEETICSCNHLTSFAVLLDLSREGITDRLQATILTFITYIGCGISAIFLSITLLTYLAFEKLRRDIPSKILIQLCAALLLLNLTFLLDSWLALYQDALGLCISTAFFLHYFLLVSFTWMGLEAFHMYLAIVKVFNSYMSRYMLRFSLFGWGVPLVVVIIVIAISKDNYGLISYGKYSDGHTDEFCWIKNDVAFYVAVVAYFCLVFAVNLAMFVVVMVQLYRIKRQNPHNSQHRSGLQELRSVAGLTFLLGLTWGFAFFAWGPVNLAFMYLFAIFNSLQGLFIFIFHCAIKDNVRKQWRTYLCCGKLRLAENTEWSRTATHSRTKKHSVITATSIPSSRSMLSSQNSTSTSFPPSDSTELPSNAGGPYEDSVITSLEESNGDVVFN